jgi:hypothetical protein
LLKPSTRQVTATGMFSARVHGPAGRSFREDVAGEVGRRPPQDLVLQLQQLVASAQLAKLRRLVLRSAAAVTAGWRCEAVFRWAIFIQRWMQDSEIP